MAEEIDEIDNAAHYACEAVTLTLKPEDLCKKCDFSFGNALKYLFRYKHKGNPVKDLKKAKHYLNSFIADNENVFQVTFWDPDDIIFLAFFREKEFFYKYCEPEQDAVEIARQLLVFIDDELANIDGLRIDTRNN